MVYIRYVLYGIYTRIYGSRFVNIKKINPIARAFAYLRKRTQVVPPKKGKGSYNRKKEKKDER